jgi:predicted methyltransferase
MRKGVTRALPLLALLSFACADSAQPAATPGNPVDPPKQNDDLAAMMNGSASAADASKASDPAEAKKAEEAKKLAEDFAKLDKDQAAEKARMSEALRKDLAALSDKKFPSFKAALEASLKSAHRAPGSADRDKERRPVEMLTFFKLNTNMSVLELDAGGGWYTELLAPILKRNGKLTVTGPNPDGAMTARPTYYGKRLRGFLDKAPELGDKVDYLVAEPEAGLVIPDDKKGTFDAVLSFRNLHGWQNRNVLDKNLTAVFDALKPGGYLGVEAHRAKPGADPKESSKKGYLPEAYVIERAEAAGFKLDQKSDINANPKDTTDHPEGVWTLPPTLRLGDKDKEKYLAIGESDRMTLRFVKPKTPAKAPAKKP